MRYTIDMEAVTVDESLAIGRFATEGAVEKIAEIVGRLDAFLKAAGGEVQLVAEIGEVGSHKGMEIHEFGLRNEVGRTDGEDVRHEGGEVLCETVDNGTTPMHR